MAIPHPHWITIEEYHQIEEQNREVKSEIYADTDIPLHDSWLNAD